MSKTEDYKHYIGDVNLEYGGMFINLDDWKYGYSEVLRITDLDSGAGFNGAVMVERLTTITDNPKEIWNAKKSYGWDKPYSLPGRTSEDRKLALVEAITSYGYYDPDDGWDNYHRGYSLIIQCDPDDDYAPMEYDGWKADVRLSEDQDLLEYLEDNGYLQDFE
jgi:hypothetical protein